MRHKQNILRDITRIQSGVEALISRLEMNNITAEVIITELRGMNNVLSGIEEKIDREADDFSVVNKF